MKLDRSEKYPSTGKLVITDKMAKWFYNYIDENNPLTFLNKTGSAKQAGYSCDAENAYAKIGSENYSKLQNQVERWLDEEGLSEAFIKARIRHLITVKEKKFFSAPVKDESGIVTGMHIEYQEVDAIETQRKTIDMASKIRGMYPASQHEVSGKNGKNIGVEHALDGSWAELLNSVTGDNQTNDLGEKED